MPHFDYINSHSYVEDLGFRSLLISDSRSFQREKSLPDNLASIPGALFQNAAIVTQYLMLAGLLRQVLLL
jgi:hypothetical protein